MLTLSTDIVLTEFSETTGLARQVAFETLRAVYRGTFADVALDRYLNRSDLPRRERSLATELVYGTVRRQRTLDALIDQFGKQSARQQRPDVRLLLHLGFYQLRYLSTIPPSAAVNTTVELAKANGQGRLSGVINGILRTYLRLQAANPDQDPLHLPADAITALGIQHSFPNWMVQLWYDQLGAEETEQLCSWLNQAPHLDLRVNCLQTSVTAVQEAFQAVGLETRPLPQAPTGLRLLKHGGRVTDLPGHGEGWWSIQDSSAQVVAYWVNPQPGEVVIDACAAPGGKATHLAELMGDSGTVWACDRTPSRIKKIQANYQRLQLTNIQPYTGDSRAIPQFHGIADRVLVDVPCSGLGTLHRHADARWRQTPESVAELTALQLDLLTEAARWLKPQGQLTYATCTLHPAENQGIIRQFLQQHPDWQIQPPSAEAPCSAIAEPEGWLQIWPHRQDMDGFFMVTLGRE
jgi:16S rRNA (cytosine967-C5)-methyltransferase